MSEEKLNDLFAQARNEVPETTQKDVLKWIGGAAFLMMLSGFVAKFKILFISKPLVMISSIITVAGISAATLALLPSRNEQPETALSRLSPKTREQLLSAVTEDNSESAFTEKVYRADVPQLEHEVASLPFTTAILGLAAPSPVALKIAQPPAASNEFHTIVVAGISDIRLVQADTFGILVTTSSGSTVAGNYEIHDGVLTVSRPLNDAQGDSTTHIAAIVSVRDLKKIVISDVSSVSSDRKLQLTDLAIESDGACNVNLQLNLRKLTVLSNGASKLDLSVDADNIEMDVLGVSTVTIKGSADNLKLTNGGASDLKARGLKVKKAVVQANGVSECRVQVSEQLEVTAGDIAKVRYGGMPKKTISVTGLAKFGRF